MRKFLVVIAFLSMFIATNSWAALINSGSLTVTNGGLALNGLATPTLDWSVNSNSTNTQWTYVYTYSTGSSNGQQLSLIDLEVLTGFTRANNLISDTVTPNDKEATGPANYNGLYGLQWDFTDFKNNTLNLTLTTNTKPMWGDIYIGGATPGYYAKNTGFGPSLNNPNPIQGGADIWTVGANKYGAVLVPTPLPPAVWLLGSGLLGLVSIRRKKTV